MRIWRDDVIWLDDYTISCEPCGALSHHDSLLSGMHFVALENLRLGGEGVKVAS